VIVRIAPVIRVTVHLRTHVDVMVDDLNYGEES